MKFKSKFLEVRHLSISFSLFQALQEEKKIRIVLSKPCNYENMAMKTMKNLTTSIKSKILRYKIYNIIYNRGNFPGSFNGLL